MNMDTNPVTEELRGCIADACARMVLIAPLVSGVIPKDQAAAYCRQMASRPVLSGRGEVCSLRPAAIMSWYLTYRDSGFRGLVSEYHPNLEIRDI